MSIKLIVEVMDHAPTTLTASEWRALAVLAEDANDDTRLTWSSVNDEKILRRIGMGVDAWKNMRASLVRKGVLEVAEAGRRGRVAKYRIVPLAPMGHQSDDLTLRMGHQSDDETEAMGHQIDDPKGKRVIGSMPPTPPNPSGGSPSPSEPPTPSAPAAGGGGDDEKRATAFLQSLPGKWACGPATAARYAPLLLEAIRAQGWDLDEELAAKLTENRGPVERYGGALKFRIGDLPKKPTAQQQRASPGPRGELCGCCGTTAPAACHYRGRAYCPACTATCATCSTPTPADQMPSGQCADCHTRSTAA